MKEQKPEQTETIKAGKIRVTFKSGFICDFEYYPDSPWGWGAGFLDVYDGLDHRYFNLDEIAEFRDIPENIQIRRID